MRTLIRWAARLYPPAWRNRYAAEFDALLDDISPSFRDVCDVLGDVLRVRATTSIDACLMLAPVSPMNLRLPVVASLTAHAVMITIVLFAVWGHVTTMPLHVVAPLPPPAPEPPPQVTDARVFPNALTLYSSLPLRAVRFPLTLRTAWESTFCHSRTSGPLIAKGVPNGESGPRKR